MGLCCLWVLAECVVQVAAVGKWPAAAVHNNKCVICTPPPPPLPEGQTFYSVGTEDTLLAAMETAGAKDAPEDAERKGAGNACNPRRDVGKAGRCGICHAQGRTKGEVAVSNRKSGGSDCGFAGKSAFPDDDRAVGNSGSNGLSMGRKKRRIHG